MVTEFSREDNITITSSSFTDQSSVQLRAPGSSDDTVMTPHPMLVVRPRASPTLQ